MWSVSSASSAESVWSVASSASSAESNDSGANEPLPLCSESAFLTEEGGEGTSSVGRANERVGSYAEVRGLHRGEWMGKVDGWRCKEFGTVLRAGTFEWNYAVHVCCYRCAGCEVWVGSLKKLDATWAAVVEMVQEELRDGVVTRADLQAVVERYGRNSLNCLQTMVQNVMSKKMVAMAVKMMIEDEAEEASGDESVDDFE